MHNELEFFLTQWARETDGTIALLSALPPDQCDVRPDAGGRSIGLLWRKLLLHTVHHRGQLSLLCRLAGGVPPGLFGRTREETLLRAAASAT